MIEYRYGAGTWSRYGFVDAFNPLTNWYDSDVIGIDTGITHGDGGKCANRFRVGHIHEESRSPARACSARDLRPMKRLSQAGI